MNWMFKPEWNWRSMALAALWLCGHALAGDKACKAVSGDNLETSIAAKYMVAKTDRGNWVGTHTTPYDVYDFQHTYYFRMRAKNCFMAVGYQSESKSWRASARSQPDEHPGCDDRWVRRVVSYEIESDAKKVIANLLAASPGQDVVYNGKVSYRADNTIKDYYPDFHFSFVVGPDKQVKAGSLTPTKLCM